MIKILRVSTHPTNIHHGVGLHPSIISENEIFDTTYVTPTIDKDATFLKPKKYKLKVSKVIFKKRNKQDSKLNNFFFQMIRIFKIISFSLFALREIKKNNIDVVHIHSPMYLLVALWGRLNGKLTCITYHGTDYQIIKTSFIYKFFSKKIINIGFCISPHMLSVVKTLHIKSYYAPNGINSKIFIDKKNERENIILAVGSLKSEKSYGNLIKAFKNILETHPQYKLNIAGDGYLKQELTELVKNLKLENKVLFLGNLNLIKLVNKYNKAKVFILSSRSEGFPKVVLEAIFCGCRVVATDVGSVSTFLPKEYVIPNNSITALTKYIIKVINKKKYEIDTIELKTRYTWENVTNIYHEAYSSNIKIC